MAARARRRFEASELRRWIPAGVAAVVLAGAGAMVIARELVSPDAPDPPATKKAQDEFVQFRDEAAGISIAYPREWKRVASPDPEVRLLAQGPDASMLVRMADLGVGFELNSLDRARRLTDRLVRAAGKAKLVRAPQQVTLGGLPGYLYLYTYPDAEAGQRGAHAHYFLFRGRTLITIVFQTVPAALLFEKAPLFDRIGETLRSAPA